MIGFMTFCLEILKLFTSSKILKLLIFTMKFQTRVMNRVVGSRPVPIATDKAIDMVCANT